MIDIRFSGPTPESLEVYFEHFSLVKPALIGWAKKFLRQEGYLVEIAHEWETIPQFCERIGITRKQFARRWKAAGRPHVDVQRGATGRRISAIASNKAFEKFCLSHGRRPGRKSAKILSDEPQSHP